MKSVTGQVQDDNGSVVGYVVYNSENHKADMIATNTLLRDYAMDSESYKNITVDGSTVKGVGCNLSKLPIFSIYGVALRNVESIFVLNRIMDKGVCVGFVLLDAFGHQIKKRYADAVMLIKRFGSSNAKLMPATDSKTTDFYISAIKGNFDEIDISSLRSKEKSAVAKPADNTSGGSKNEPAKGISEAKHAIVKFRPKQHRHKLFKKALIHNYAYRRYGSSYVFDTRYISSVIKAVKTASGDSRRTFNTENDKLHYMRGYDNFITIGTVTSVLTDNTSCLQSVNALNEIAKGDDAVKRVCNVRPPSMSASSLNHLIDLHNATIAEIKVCEEFMNSEKYISSIVAHNNGERYPSYEYELMKKIRRILTHNGIDFKSLTGTDDEYMDLENRGIIDEVKSLVSKERAKLVAQCNSRSRRIDRARNALRIHSQYNNSKLPSLDSYLKNGVIDYIMANADKSSIYKKEVISSSKLMEFAPAIFLELCIKDIVPARDNLSNYYSSYISKTDFEDNIKSAVYESIARLTGSSVAYVGYLKSIL